MLDLRNRPQLIVCLRVLKALFKLLLQRRIRRKRKAGPSFPLGVELDEPRGQVLCRRLGLSLGFLPLVAAELIELDGCVLAAADVFGDQVELCGGDIERVAALIGDFDIVLDNTVDLHLLHADVAADAVVFMHDQVARRQVGEGIELLAVRGLGAVLARLAFARGEQLPLRQDGEMQDGIFRAEGQRAVGEQELPRLRQLRQREGEKGREVLFTKQLGKNLSAAAVAAQDERGKLVFLVELQVGCRRVQIAALGGKLRGRDAIERPVLQALRARGG